MRAPILILGLLLLSGSVNADLFPDEIKQARGEREAGTAFWRQQYVDHASKGRDELHRWLGREIQSRKEFIARQRAWLAHVEPEDQASNFAKEARAWVETETAVMAQRQLELIALEAPQHVPADRPAPPAPAPAAAAAAPLPGGRMSKEDGPPSSMTDADLARVIEIQRLRIAREAKEAADGVRKKPKAVARRKSAASHHAKSARPDSDSQDSSSEDDDNDPDVSDESNGGSFGARRVCCCDGTVSPTCVFAHRGCCSWHGGVCGCK